MEKTTEVFAGIDVAKHKVDVHFYPTNEAFTFRTDTETGLSSLIAALKTRSPKRIVYESTGGYGRRIATALEEAGIDAHCVPAQRVRKFAEAIGLKAKTDTIDAEAISRFGASAKLVDRVTVTPATRELRKLVIRRSQLTKLNAREKNHRETMDESLLESWTEMQVAIDKNIAVLDEAIVAAVNADEELKKRAAVLSTIKGMGIASVAATLVFMPELGKISSKQAVSLVGVAPFNNESGESDKPRSIDGGRRRLRCALYMAMLTAVVHDEKLKPFYERLLANKKPKMVALTAAMRKLVVIANARMRDAFPANDSNEGRANACDQATQLWRPSGRRKRPRERAKATR